MSKTTERIAVLLGVTEPEAREFCLKVQGKFRQSATPRFQHIKNCLERKPHATLKEVVDSITRDPAYSRGLSGLSRKKPRIIATYLAGSSRPTGKKIGKKRGHFALEDIAKCPHGVPKVTKCAICDPKGFKRQTGL